MRKRTLPIVLLLSGLLLWSCYPDGPAYTEDLDLVVSHHNPDYNFAAGTTYAMPTKIVKLTGNVGEGELPEFIPDVTAQQILARISQNMDALGWQKIGVDADPDVFLVPASWETTTVVYWYDYWYWWYGGYYPGYGGGYYPPVYVDSYTTGTLVMMITDPAEVGGSGNPIPQWTGAINGLLSGKFNPQRALPAIDQAFDQSPYLKTN